MLALPLTVRAAAPPSRPPAPAESVVKVTATLRFPKPFRPWAPSKSTEVAGTPVGGTSSSRQGWTTSNHLLDEGTAVASVAALLPDSKHSLPGDKRAATHPIN
jgi:hypothetical protein